MVIPKKKIFIIIGLLFVACKSIKKPFIAIDRCNDCIYLEDYRNYELVKGSKELTSKKEMLFENVFQWKFPEGEISMSSNPLKCFMRKEAVNDELNIIVCYQIQKVKGAYVLYNDTLVEAEYYKIFLKEGHLDKEGIDYPQHDGKYSSLKNYFKALTAHLPNSSRSTPKNIQDITDSKIKNDVKSYIDSKQQTLYTMTVNSSAFVDYMNTPETHTIDDMGIYVTYLAKTPHIAFSNIYESTKEAKDFIEHETYSQGKLKKVYNSLDSVEKQRLKIIRKNRDLIPFTELIDSVNLYRNKWIKEKNE
ncbi:hypothetical protein H2O64_21670 [Kordia sp. YSTF-M3]|uniref:Lipoprotein n=1 Tax=Kordia aestuariivivens TaxID=2759037 RepID=A0ABR7QG73_9FLAO|nr:hypothetical protein [Kordia aestuariivivens]MBC8757294.1 hypothetical protein [Kordia aestuariivivens]